MLRKGIILAIFVVSASVTILSISAQESQIPAWVKGVANFWVEGNISDGEFGEAITFLIEQNIIRVAMPNTADNTDLKNKISQLESENTRLENQISVYKLQNSKLQSEIDNIQDSDYTVDNERVVPYEANKIQVNVKGRAGPFEIEVTDAGYSWFNDDDGNPEELFRVSVKVTNIRHGNSVTYAPTIINLVSPGGYALQHEYTNGLKANTKMPSGTSLTGFYTFEKPSKLGEFRLFLDLTVLEDIRLGNTFSYDITIPFSLKK